MQCTSCFTLYILDMFTEVQMLVECYTKACFGGHLVQLMGQVSGVPQGTVLGPLMFLTYINDIHQELSSNIRLFADDALLYRPILSEQDTLILQNDINTYQCGPNNGKCLSM